MNKDVNIKVVYQGKSEFLECPRARFFNDVAKRFNLNPTVFDFVIVDKTKKTKILKPADLKNGSVVEVIPRGAIQKYLQQNDGGESSKMESNVEKIITKLKNNTILNGPERKYLIDVLEAMPTSSTLGKRKHEDLNGYTMPLKLNKKVQAQPISDFQKDSYTQTEIAPVAFESHHESSNEAEDIINKMKRVAAQEDQNKEEIQALMDSSYKERRQFLLVQCPLVVIMREKYPLLFSTNEIKNELDRMFYVGKCDEFMKNIDKYSNIILDSCHSSNPVLQRTLKSLDQCHTVKQKKYAKAVGSVLVIPSLLDENILFLSTCDNDAKSEIYPYIDCYLHSLKAVYFDNMLFKVMTEKQLVCEATNFKEAILCLMACFFIFNIDYTKNCEKTLTVFEKIYLCANDTHNIDSNAEQLISLFKLKAKDK